MTSRLAEAGAPRGELPVAVVVVDTGLAHLDHPFEYAVPAAMAEAAQPGARVRVRFAGRDVDGFVVQRRAVAEHLGPLAELGRVVSPEPVLTPTLLALCQAVADRYAGSLGDVLRLAIPKRHAAAERALPMDPPVVEPLPMPPVGPWAAYPAGPAFLRRIGDGGSPAAAWTALPGRQPEMDWPAALATAAQTALAAGRGALLIVPDHRDVARLDSELRARLGPGRHVRLTADQGPQARYTAWLKVLRGHVRCVVGTRSAAFAPVADLGLVAWWDDGDDLHAEPRAPYPQVRDVLLLRATAQATAAICGGFGRSVDLAQLVADGSFASIDAAAPARREAAARVVVAGEGDLERAGGAARARLAPSAWRAASAALADGPVLVQVPRHGYLPALSCQDCRQRVRCPRCQGPVTLPSAGATALCRWCALALPVDRFQCPHCQGRRIRSAVVGSARTAEELGRAFPGVRVLTSSAGSVLESVGAEPTLVVATPGAEPVADGGYAACLLLDAWALLDRADLDAPLEALRRWMTAAALVRPGPAGGVVVLVGVPEGVHIPAVDALVRWAPEWLAGRELDERRTLTLPPTVLFVQATGDRHAVAEVAAQAQAVDGAVTILGPLPVTGTDQVRVIIRAPLPLAAVLADTLVASRAVRSARKEPGTLTVRMWDRVSG